MNESIISKLICYAAALFMLLVTTMGFVMKPALAEDLVVLGENENVHTVPAIEGIVAVEQEESETGAEVSTVEREPGAVTPIGDTSGDEQKSENLSPVEAMPSVSYHAHVQTYGDQAAVADGAVAGTTGQGKRLEAVWLSVSEPVTGGIEYRTHVQGYGWQAWVADGIMSGTSGQAKRLEAVQIRLTGELADRYDVWYRVHAQRIGWMTWASNGEEAGTSGLAWRLEALQVLIVPKGEGVPDDVAGVRSEVSFAYTTVPSVAYRTHVQTYGWQEWVVDGAMSGTSGQSKRLEALEATLDAGQVSGGIQYRTHVQTYGWQGWVADGAMGGTEGKEKRLEAISVELTGDASRYFDVWYRVHVQTFGWLDWAKNGEEAGTERYSKRMEAIEIRVLPKGSSAPGSTSCAFRKFTSGDAELDSILEYLINTRTGRGSDALRRGYDYVVSRAYSSGPARYSGNWQSWSVPLAKQMYYYGAGNCYCYASLMTWIARALGYDAHPRQGEVMVSTGWAAHCWCEVDQGGRTYIIDCERQKFIPSRNFFMVTYDTAPVYYR